MKAAGSAVAPRINVVIAGGGTAGHVNPAIALARALDATVTFIGTPRGAETRLVPAAGFPLEHLDVRGFDRARPWALPLVGARALVAAHSARALLRRLQPDCVVGMGGYVSLPVGLAARSLKVPLVVHEQNIVLGLANRVLRRFAARVCVSFEDTLRDLDDSGVFVGNPVSSSLVGFDRDAVRRKALDRFDLDPSRPTLLVFGGSLGARTINEAAAGLSQRWASRRDRQVLHIAGAAQPVLPGGGEDLIFRSVAYVEDMSEAYALADLALCRGGANTVAELTVTQVPAVIVPYPHHRDRQQARHAEVLRSAGAARVLDDAQATTERVAELADALLGNPQALDAMRSALGGLARPDAANALAGVVREVAR